MQAQAAFLPDFCQTISYPRHILHRTLLPLVCDYHHLGRWTKQILLRESKVGKVFQQRFNPGTFFVIPTTSLLSWPQRLHSCCCLGCWPHDTWRKWNHEPVPKSIQSLVDGWNWKDHRLQESRIQYYTVYFYYGRHDLMHPVASIHSMKFHDAIIVWDWASPPWRSLSWRQWNCGWIMVDHKRDTWTCNFHEGLSQFLLTFRNSVIDTVRGSVVLKRFWLSLAAKPAPPEPASTVATMVVKYTKPSRMSQDVGGYGSTLRIPHCFYK